MANALSITVKESLKDLRSLLKKSADHHGPKIKMLIEIKRSDRALGKNELAELIGVNHNSIQTWRTKYQKGGISKLLKDGRIGFKPSIISKSVHKKIKLKLCSEDAAFSSYKQLHAWVENNFIKGVNYNSLRHYVKRHFGASLKVPRKSHIKRIKKRLLLLKKLQTNL
ncbi:MAG: helix-turn-helix domain-containing protein [Crocinitomicaceae bacterium]|nr:helix-turn-helix domain-containing protein [Crocinitomicaceae bacterium]